MAEAAELTLKLLKLGLSVDRGIEPPPKPIRRVLPQFEAGRDARCNAKSPARQRLLRIKAKRSAARSGRRRRPGLPADVPALARSVNLSSETGGECHEIACDRRRPRGRSASLGCGGCVANTHDARARLEGHAHRDDC